MIERLESMAELTSEQIQTIRQHQQNMNWGKLQSFNNTPEDATEYLTQWESICNQIVEQYRTKPDMMAYLITDFSENPGYMFASDFIKLDQMVQLQVAYWENKDIGAAAETFRTMLDDMRFYDNETIIELFERILSKYL